MTKPARVHIVFLLDRSGSMDSIAKDVVGGFNSFLAEQRLLPDKARMTLVQFDTQDPQEVIHDAVDIAKVSDLTGATFAPRGGTPLLDAMGNLIASTQARLDRRKIEGKRDEKVLFAVFTDGQENQSHSYTKEQIQKLVSDKENDGWVFAYMGSDLNAYDDARSSGFAYASTQVFEPDTKGVYAAYGSMSASTTSLRSNTASGIQTRSEDFYAGGGGKTAEADKEQRTGTPAKAAAPVKKAPARPPAEAHGRAAPAK